MKAFAVWNRACTCRRVTLTVRARVLLVDDIQGIRGGLRSLLASESLEICGEAADGEEAIEKVRELHPDVVILDILMPVMNGIEAARVIRRIAPSTKILFFTIEDVPQARAIARSLGVDGFVPKVAARNELISTIRSLFEDPRLSRN
jgi:DNA-binding NarL/FixJ family response regulator